MCEPESCVQVPENANGTLADKHPQGRGGRWRGPWLWAALGVIAVILGLNNQLLRGRATPIWDADGYFAPYHMLIADAIRSGRLLYWDPWTTCGSPAAADPQIGAFSPLTLACAWITGGTLWGFVAYWMLIWVLGGLGMLLLARWLGAAAWGGLIVALGFAFNGILTGHAQHTSHLVSFAFVPWVIWRLDHALVRRSWFSAVQAGALLGLSSLSGYPAMTLLTGVLAGAWALARGLTWAPASQGTAATLSRLRQLGWAGWMVGVVGVVSLVVFSPTYLAFKHETAGFSTRHGVIPRAVAMRSGISWANLATTVSPSVNAADSISAAGSADRRRVIKGSGSCGSIYAGTLLLVLAVAGVATRPRDLFRGLLAVLVLLCLAAAMSGELPVYGWLYDNFPPLRYSQRAFVVRDYAVFLAAVMAALTLRDVVQMPPSERRRVWFAAAVASLVIAALVPLAWHLTGVSRGLVEAYRLAWLGDVALYLAVGAVLFWLGRACCNRGSRQQWAGGAALAALLLLALADAGLSWYWNWPITATERPEHVGYWKKMEASHSASLDLQADDTRSRGTWIDNHHLIAKAPKLRGYTVLRNPAYNSLDESGTLAQLAGSTTRFWFASQATSPLPLRPPTPRKKTRTLPVATQPSDPGKAILQVAARDSVLSQGEAGAAQPFSLVAADRAEVVLQPAQVQVRWYDPTHLQLEGTFAEPGWLLVADRWSPSWRVRVNGQEVPIHLGQAVFRAVQVQAGACTIEFWFDPPYRRWIWISWTTLAAVGALSILAAVRRRPSCERQGGGMARA